MNKIETKKEAVKKFGLKIKKVFKKTGKAIKGKFYKKNKFLAVKISQCGEKIFYGSIKRGNRAWALTIAAYLIAALAISPVFIINSSRLISASTNHIIHQYVNGVCSEATIGADISHPGWDDGSCSAPSPAPTPTPVPSSVPSTNHIIHQYVNGVCSEATIGADIAHPGWDDGVCAGPILSPTFSPEPTAPPAVTPSVSPVPSVSPEVSALPSPSASPAATPSVSPEVTVSPSVSPEPSVSPVPSVSPEAIPSPSPIPSASPESSATPVAVSSGGGGGVIIQSLVITNETKAAIKEKSVTITWATSHFSTSRVIYDTISGKFDANSASPAYGYKFYKEGDDSGMEKATFHNVTLTDIIPGTIYYYRTVSVGSLAISQEGSFVLPEFVPSPSPLPLISPILSAPSEIASVPLISPSVLTPAGQVLNSNENGNIETSIVDYLGSLGQSRDFDYRARLAMENGILDYTGTAEQNIRLLSIIKNSVARKNPDEKTEEIQEQNNAPLDSAVNGDGETPANAVENPPVDNNKLQAGLFGILEKDSAGGGILKEFGRIIAVVLVLAAAAVLSGKEFWVKLFKKAKN